MKKEIKIEKKEKEPVNRTAHRELLARVAAVFMVVILLSGIAASAFSLF